MTKPRLLASSLLLVALLIAFWRAEQSPAPIPLTPTLTGQVEYCLTCHSNLPDISPSHPVKTFGCVICHGGERLALDATLAHSTMRGGRNPSDLVFVEGSCGGEACHSGNGADLRDHIQRVQTSLQATYTGAIANIRYTFGAQPDLSARFGILSTSSVLSDEKRQLQLFDPAKETNSAIISFAQNCLTCHLNATPRPELQYTRLTGCAACHTPTSGQDLRTLKEKGNMGGIHRLTIQTPYTQCNACHNRGNYDLRQMQFIARQDHPVDRLNDYYQPIAQFTRCEFLLDCVDCHTRQEAMGDGMFHDKQKDFQYVRCYTCHGTLKEPPRTRLLTDLNDIAFRLAFLNPVVELKLGDTIVVTEQGEPLWNFLLLADGTYEFTTKVSGKSYKVPQVKGSGCTQQLDQQASQYCHECHAVQK